MTTTEQRQIASLPGARARQRRWPLVALGLVLALAVVAGYKAWRISGHLAAVRASLALVEAQLEPPFAIERLARVGPEVAALRRHTAALHAEAAPLVPLAALIAGVPGATPELAQAGPLLDMGLQLAVAADEGYTALAPVIVSRELGAASLNSALVDQLVDARPRLERARRALAEAEAARTQLDAASLSEPVRTRLADLDGALPVAYDALDLALILPAMLGGGGRQEFLLLAQNPDELRATGGFISGAGVLAFERGQLVELSLGDSVAVDDIARNYYPDPPAPMLQYMNIEQWLLRDANWSPDFPTTARTALTLYGMGQRRALNDAVAFDPYLMRGLLEAIGPVRVAGASRLVDAGNVLEQLRVPEGLPGGPGREEFKRRLARAILDELWANAATLDIWAVGGALRAALDGKHLLVYTQDPAAAAFFARKGWDGAVRTGDGDFLMVVASNVGYNKANASVEQSLSYAVDLGDPATPRATLTVRHRHLVRQPGPCEQWAADGVAGDAEYAGWMERCLFNYLRVLAPAGSVLMGSRNEPTPRDWLMSGAADDGAVTRVGDEAGAAVFAGLVVVPRATERETALSYALPRGVLVQDGRLWRYQLSIQKQPGTLDTLVALTLRLPPGARLVSSSLTAADVQGEVVRFETRLDRDRRIEVVFER